MAQDKALHILPSAFVLDRAAFIEQSADNMAATITAITNGGKPLLVVPQASKFFSIQNLMELLANKSPNAQLVAEKLATPDGKTMLEEFAKGLGAPADEPVVAPVEPAAPAAPGYPFAPVPEGWSIGADCSLGPTKIRRKRKNQEGDGTEMYLHPDVFKTMWAKCSAAWANNKCSVNIQVTTPVGVKQATIFKNEVVINGFGTIRRYEIEQIANYRGWIFPEVKIAA